MGNEWREHVKKTMVSMKAASNGKVVMLKDVLKAAAKTYKKSKNVGVAVVSSNKKSSKRKSSKRKSFKRKSSKRKSSKRKSSKRKSSKRKSNKKH